MTPAMDTAPGAKIPAAASGVGVGEDAEPADSAESVESWLLVPPVPAESVPVAAFEESVVVAVFAPAVLVDVLAVVAAAEL